MAFMHSTCLKRLKFQLVPFKWNFMATLFFKHILILCVKKIKYNIEYIVKNKPRWFEDLFMIRRDSTILWLFRKKHSSSFDPAHLNLYKMKLKLLNLFFKITSGFFWPEQLEHNKVFFVESSMFQQPLINSNIWIFK